MIDDLYRLFKKDIRLSQTLRTIETMELLLDRIRDYHLENPDDIERAFDILVKMLLQEKENLPTRRKNYG